MSRSAEPDPGMIGGVAQPDFARLPDPVPLFQTRARRFAFLAQSSRLGPYLAFLSGLAALQARLAAAMPPPVLPGPAPLDRAALAEDPALFATLAALCAGAADLDMPGPARLALQAVTAADAPDRRWLLGNVLSERIPEDSAAPHLFAAAAVQVHLARLAAQLDAKSLRPSAPGACPACGGRPVTSTVTGAQGIENIRYATCATCATQWNVVRITCLCCGSTKGISYRSAETTEAMVKAECCGECGSWVKILYATKNPTLEPVADDVGSLGLDLMMKETGLKRGGFNPFLVGY